MCARENMVNTFLDSAFEDLDWLEKNCIWASPILEDQILNFIQKSKGRTIYECLGDLERISADIKAVAEEAAVFRVNEVKEEQIQEMNLASSRFLPKMKLIKAEIFLLRQDSAETSVFLGKDNFRALHESLKFLRSLPIDLSDEKDEDGNLLPKHVQTLATEVTSIVYSIHCNKLADDIAMKVKVELDMLPHKIKLIELDLYLTELQNSSVNPVSPVKDQIADLHEGLLFLRTFLMNTKDIETIMEDGKLFSAHVVNESSLLISSSCGLSEINLSIFRLLVKIRLIKAEVMLMGLMKSPEVVSIAQVRDEIEILRQGISFLRAFLMNPPKEEEESLVAKSEAIANVAASTIFSFHYQVRNEHMTLETNHLLSDLVDKIELLKAEIKDAYLLVPYLERSNLPKLEGKEIISSFLEDMDKMLNREAKSLPFMRSQIDMLFGEFKFLESFINDTEELYINNQELKDVWECITDVARQINYIIDLFVVRDYPVWHLMLWISFAMENIKLIKAKVMEFYDEGMFDLGSHSIASARSLEINDPVYELDGEKLCIVDQLTRGTKEMRIISILGMATVGKTTLAKSVYRDRSVVQHFTCRAWCCVSRQYKRRECLLKILCGLIAVTDSIYEMDEDELAAKLYNCSKHKRFLIVLDDIWDVTALEDLRSLFSDDETGSRILLTTRVTYVAIEVDADAFTHHLRLLRDDECWMLLRNRIFGNETPDLPFMEVLAKIAQYCKGLFIIVNLIAGVLANTERELSRWVHVEQTLSLINSEGGVFSVIQYAYECLPERLKPYFLCFKEFEEDEISARKLLQLWIARGLIQQTDPITLEDIADDYLSEFISRNWVTVSKRRYNGKIRAVRIYALLQVSRMRKKRRYVLSIPMLLKYFGHAFR